jgi:hypothetical protein
LQLQVKERKHQSTCWEYQELQDNPWWVFAYIAFNFIVGMKNLLVNCILENHTVWVTRHISSVPWKS